MAIILFSIVNHHHTVRRTCNYKSTSDLVFIYIYIFIHTSDECRFSAGIDINSQLVSPSFVGHRSGWRFQLIFNHRHRINDAPIFRAVCSTTNQWLFDMIWCLFWNLLNKATLWVCLSWVDISINCHPGVDRMWTFPKKTTETRICNMLSTSETSGWLSSD